MKISGFLQGISLRRILVILLIVLCAVYVVPSLVSPLRQSVLTSEKYTGLRPDSLADIPVTRAETERMMRKSYLGAAIQMASEDSAGLCIHLPDSTISLCIRGVVVHEARATRFHTGVFFNRLHPGVVTSLFEKPSHTESFFSTIPREPILRVKAPRDTIEAAKMAIMQDTSDTHAVFFLLSTDRGYDVLIGQSEKDFKGARRARGVLLLKYRCKRAWLNLMDIAGMKIPEYRPLIRVEIPRKDARVIFRALPQKAPVVTALQYR